MENKKNHIVKSNSLIDCSYKLTLTEQRLINLGCKKLKPIFIDKNVSIEEMRSLIMANLFDEIEISVPEYKNEFNVKSNNVYGELEKNAESLYGKSIIYYDDTGSLVKKRWVITCKFNKSTKKVTLRFHPDLIMDLLIFKGKYTKLNYGFLTGVKSFYASRLYELLRQYLNIGARTFDVDDIRFRFNLMDGEYPRYANFKQKVLNPSIEWINNNSDITVELEETKTGRSVTRIRFIINDSDDNCITKKVIQGKRISTKEENSVYSKIKSIIDIPLSAEQVDSICDSAINGLKINDITDMKPMDYIDEKWTITKSYCTRKNNVNTIGFLLSALRNDYKVETLKKVIQISFDDKNTDDDIDWLDEELGIHKSSNNYTSNNSKRFK